MEKFLNKHNVDADVDCIAEGVYSVRVNNKDLDLVDVENCLREQPDKVYLDYSLLAKQEIQKTYARIIERVQDVEIGKTLEVEKFSIFKKDDNLFEIKTKNIKTPRLSSINNLPYALHELHLQALRDKIVLFPGTEGNDVDRTAFAFSEVYANLKKLVRHHLRIGTSNAEYDLLSDLLYVATGYEEEDEALMLFNLYLDRILNEADELMSPVLKTVLVKFINKIFRSAE